MSNVIFKLNQAGVRELLKSSEAQSICREHAARIQSSAGENYEISDRNYPERSGVAVRPANAEGYYDNLRNNTLLKAVGK